MGGLFGGQVGENNARRITFTTRTKQRPEQPEHGCSDLYTLSLEVCAASWLLVWFFVPRTSNYENLGLAFLGTENVVLLRAFWRHKCSTRRFPSNLLDGCAQSGQSEGRQLRFGVGTNVQQVDRNSHNHVAKPTTKDFVWLAHQKERSTKKFLCLLRSS